MNRCILQLWEESERGWGVRPDGCTIHLNEECRNNYINGVYKNRQIDTKVPDEYDRPIGNAIECFVSDNMYEKVDQVGSIRLFEYEKNNLIKMEEIIIKS